MSGRSPRWFTGIKYPYEANFADNTWAQVIAACQRGTVPETWAVGNQKTMTINGISYQIDIIGKNHDTYTAGGTAPLTFQLHECYHEKKRMNLAATNKGGWTTATVWRERSPSADYDYMFCNVYSTGTSSQSDANYDRGVAFAFCF